MIDSHGRLIASFRRIKAFQHLGRRTIPARVIDIAEALRAERDENAIRKNFTPSEAVAIAEALEEEEKKLAHARKGHGQTAPGKHSGTIARSDEPGRAKARIARSVGMSRRTLEASTKVVKAAKAEPAKFGLLVEEMDPTGKVEPAFRKLKQASGNGSNRNAKPGSGASPIVHAVLQLCTSGGPIGDGGGIIC